MSKRQITIHADGAASPNPGIGGWGCVLFDPAKDYRKELSGFQAVATNNQMELTAVIEAFSALKAPCKVTLNSDSQYVVNAFSKKWIQNWESNGWYTSAGKPVKNKELWVNLLEAIKPHDVAWVWCKGHDGNEWNERCDELATQAVEVYRKLSQ